MFTRKKPILSKAKDGFSVNPDRSPEKSCAVLQLLVEFACGAGDVHSAWRAALSVLDALYNAGRFRALGAVRALGGIHFLFTVARFRNLCHDVSNLLPLRDPRDFIVQSLLLARFAST
jgi:hypothetical protein